MDLPVESNLLTNLLGNPISKTPNRESARTMNMAASAKFIHGLFAKRLRPVAPAMIETPIPRIVNVPIIPALYKSAEVRLDSPSFFFEKKLTVMGIIGKTQGVKRARNPAEMASHK